MVRNKHQDYLRNERLRRQRYGNPFGTRRRRKSSGCYIATAVYGSYDCPEVWVLRRYRDLYLENSFFGRHFISLYYYLSPKFVKQFGDTEAFKTVFRKYLDKKVLKLKRQGYSDTPYND